MHPEHIIRFGFTVQVIADPTLIKLMQYEMFTDLDMCIMYICVGVWLNWWKCPVGIFGLISSAGWEGGAFMY